jgi:hypothetical protein
MRRFKMIVFFLLVGLVVQGCKKDNKTTGSTDSSGNQDDGIVVTTTGPVVAPTDASIAKTQGFWLDNWQAKTFTAPASQDATKPTVTIMASVSIDLTQVLTKVSPYLFGNNANPYIGQLNDPGFIANLTNLAPRIIRLPGGSLSDEYFWNAPKNIPPADVPAQLLDQNGNVDASKGYWYGQNTDTWTCTVDNYYSLLQQTGSTGIITVNYGYARYGTSAHPDQVAAHLAAQWVRYDHGRTKFWEVGNECYGNWEAGYRIDQSKNKDGQPAIITGALYGQHFKVFADSMRKAAADVGATIKIGAVMEESNPAPSSEVSNWNAGVLSAAGNYPDFFIVHNYYTAYNQQSNVAQVLATPASVTSSMMDWMKTTVTNGGVDTKPVALTEWNIQALGLKQQVSNIAGLHAVMTLGEIIRNQFGEASRWDLANGWDSGNDQGLFSRGDEGDITPAWTLRPAFYYLYYFQKFFGDRMVPSTVDQSADIKAYASSFSSGEAGVILVNTSNTDQLTKITLKNFNPGDKYYYYTLNGGTDDPVNGFSRKVYVNGQGPTISNGGPANYASIAAYSAAISGGIRVTVPGYGAMFVVISNKK